MCNECKNVFFSNKKKKKKKKSKNVEAPQFFKEYF